MIDFDGLLNEGYVVNKEFIARLDSTEQENFVHYLKSEYFRPGEKVKICSERVDAAIAQVKRISGDTRVLQSLLAADQKVLEIEKVYFKDERDISFKLTTSDVLFDASYFRDSRPTLNMYGVILLVEDRIFALELDGKEPARVLKGYEIQGEVEIGFGGVLGISNREEFKTYLENEVERKGSLCGEFYISDEGMETWCLSAKAWFTGASPQELEVANSYVEEILSAGPKPN